MDQVKVTLERAGPELEDRQEQTIILERDLFIRIALAILNACCTDTGCVAESGDEWNFVVDELLDGQTVGAEEAREQRT